MALPVSLMDDSLTPQGNVEHRAPGRFPIERELRFRMTGRRSDIAGSGRTIDMSSKNLVFRTDKPLLPGKRLEMAISWPAQLDNRCAMKLIARGKIVSVELGCVAVSIEQYEFRTLGHNGLTI